MDFVDEKPHKMHERMLEWGEWHAKKHHGIPGNEKTKNPKK